VSLPGHEPEWARAALQVAITVWMLVVAVLDHRTGRIPNAVVLPVMLGVGLFRLVQGVLGEPVRFLLLLAWILIFFMWMAHFIGGGDAKFLMGMYALFPSMEFTAVLAFFLLIVTVPLMVWGLRGRSPGRLKESLQARMITGQMLPTEEELHTRGRRYAWTFVIPGIVYTWVYW
jgi:Flp pilus assembly protein protease CpaA